MVDRIEKERKINTSERSEELIKTSKLPLRMQEADQRDQCRTDQYRQKGDINLIFKQKAQIFTREIPKST